jgi:hypothetical protein
LVGNYAPTTLLYLNLPGLHEAKNPNRILISN